MKRAKLDVGEVASYALLIILTIVAIAQIVAYLTEYGNALARQINVLGSAVLLFFGLFAVLLTWSYSRSRRRRAVREYADLLLVGIGAVSFLTVAFSEISIILAVWFHRALSDEMAGGDGGEAPSTSVHDVVEMFLREACRTIPGLEAPDTIGWRPAVEDPSVILGVCLLTYKAILILGIVSSVLSLWKGWRVGSEEDIAAQAANKSASNPTVAITPADATDVTDAGRATGGALTATSPTVTKETSDAADASIGESSG